MRFLIFGTGAVGQLYGGFLHRAGHDITFLTRPERLAGLQERGIRLLPEKDQPGSVITIPDARFIDHLDSLDAFDFVFVCVRADQREEARSTFQGLHCAQKGAIVAFPAWRATLDSWGELFGSCHCMYPGIMALFRGDDVVYKLSKTKLAPLSGTLAEESERCDHAGRGGVPSEMTRPEQPVIRVIMAMGFRARGPFPMHKYNPTLR